MNTIVILMPSLNMNRLFIQAYKTVLAQIDTDWVVYAMDAIGEDTEEQGEHQDLLPVVQQLNKKHGERIVYHKQKTNEILGQALNELYEYAVQDGYTNFTFLAADDSWHPQKLEIQRFVYNENKKKHPFLLVTKAFGMLVKNYVFDDSTENDITDLTTGPTFYSKSNYSLKRIVWNKGVCPVFSGAYFTKDFIDRKKIMSKGKFTSYDYPYCFDCEFYAELEMAGLGMFELDKILTYYEFCNNEANSLGFKVIKYPHIRKKDLKDRENLREKLRSWRENANNR